MAFGSTVDNEIIAAVLKKLDPWLNNIVDYDDVQEAYRERGRLQADRIKLLREIECVEDDVLRENGKPRSNEARIQKLNATTSLRNRLSEIEAQIAENDARCKFLEFRKSMFSAAVFRTRIQMDM